MENLTSDNIIILFLSLGVLLALARLLGEMAQWVRQPAVLGELLAGVLLGPTVLGQVAPELNALLFPQQGTNAVALEAIATLAIALFLLVAGMEVDLSSIWRQGLVGCKVGITSIVMPFTIALLTALAIPESLGRPAKVEPLYFALFFAIAISISALPIIAKTLMDMGLFRSNLGMVIISAAVFNDLVGWIVFAVILGLIGHGDGNGIVMTIALTLAFVTTTLTVGRWLIDRALPLVSAYTRWPGGELSFALILGLFGAAFTQWIGIHAILGAFIVGVAIGDSSHLHERSRVIIDKFISFIFAPVFFASIGLKVNFLAHFDLNLVLLVLLIACSCKLIGGVVGARWGGMPSRDAWAVGFGMVSVGAMGIIVGMIALEAGIIEERLFVALIIMAMVTSMMSGPFLQLILGPNRERRLRHILAPILRATSRRHLRPRKSRGQGISSPEVGKALLRRQAKTPRGPKHYGTLARKTRRGFGNYRW